MELARRRNTSSGEKRNAVNKIWSLGERKNIERWREIDNVVDGEETGNSFLSRSAERKLSSYTRIFYKIDDFGFERYRGAFFVFPISSRRYSGISICCGTHRRLTGLIYA